MEWMGEVRSVKSKEGKEGKEGLLVEWRQKFVDAMNADLNTPAALSIIFDCMTWARNKSTWKADERAALDSFIEMIRLTFGCFEPEEEKEIPAGVQKLLDAREAARAAKDFAKSDALRDQIRETGYEVRDVGGKQEVRKM